MIEITGLWLNETSKGEKYFVGYMGNAKILIFKNKYKQVDSQPEYRMFIVEKQDVPAREEKQDDVEF